MTQLTHRSFLTTSPTTTMSALFLILLTVAVLNLLSSPLFLTPVLGVTRTSAPAVGLGTIDIPDAVTFTVSTKDSQPSDIAVQGKLGYYPSPYAGLPLPESSNPDYSVDMPVMLPHKDDDPYACSGPLRQYNEFNQSFTGAWIIIQNSQCSDSHYQWAAASGARGVIVYNCPPEAPYLCEDAVQSMIIRTSIPGATVVSIRHGDGLKYVAYLQAKQAAAGAGVAIPRDTLVFSAISTGAILPAERTALISIMQQTKMGSFAQQVQLDILPLWTVARFQNMSLDPCRDRVKGIWCEAGRIVLIYIFYHVWATPNGIPAEFSVFTELRTLTVHVNAWTGPIPNSWCSLTKLRSFKFSQMLAAPFVTALPNCAFPALESVIGFSSSITALPELMSSWSKLRVVSLWGNKIAYMPSLSALSQLSYFDVSQNALSGSFPSFHPSAPLSVIAIGTNSFSGAIPVTQLDHLNKLTVLDINNNHFSGLLPNLIDCAKLQVVDLGSQRNLSDPSSTGFTGELPTSWYSSLPALVTLNLQENSITCTTLISTALMTNLQHLDLSHNLLTNPPVLPSWPNGLTARTVNAMVSSSLIYLNLGYNQLDGPVGTMDPTVFRSTQKIYLNNNKITTLFAEVFAMPALTLLDMSYNNISSTTVTFSTTPPAATFDLLNVVGNPYFVMTFNLPWLTASTSRTQLQGTKYACATLGSKSAAAMVFNVDPVMFGYKYCECQAGTFGKAPLCSAIPSNAHLGPYTTVVSQEVGDTFEKLLQAALNITSFIQPMSGSTNSSSSNSTSQTTNVDTYISTDTRSDDSYISPVNATSYLQEFTDSFYGANRLTPGLTTSFVIDVSNLYAENSDSYRLLEITPPQSTRQIHKISTASDIQASWTPVRVITIRFHLNPTLFTQFDDVITVYSGDESLRGDRIIARHGTDPMPIVTGSEYTQTTKYQQLYSNTITKMVGAGNTSPYFEVRVFSPQAAIQFTSRHTSGQHFFATYSYSFECPTGYFYDTVTDATKPQCKSDYLLYQTDSGIRSAVFAVGGIALAIVTIIISVLLLHWNHPVFKAASRSFLLLLLCLMEAMALGSLLFAAVPSVGTHTGDALCNGRVWLTCLPLAGLLAIVCAKNRRLWSIFGATKLHVKVHSDLDLLISVLVVCTLQGILLAVFSGIPLTKGLLALGKGSISDRLVVSCSQETGFMSWIGAEIAFILALMLPTAYLGFKTRNLPSQYNESAHLQNALVILGFFGVIIVPLAVFIQNDPEASILIQGLGLAFLTIVLTAIIFFPKVYLVFASTTGALATSAITSPHSGLGAASGPKNSNSSSGVTTNNATGSGSGSHHLGGKPTAIRTSSLNTISGGPSQTPKSRPASAHQQPAPMPLFRQHTPITPSYSAPSPPLAANPSPPLESPTQQGESNEAIELEQVRPSVSEAQHHQQQQEVTGEGNELSA